MATHHFDQYGNRIGSSRTGSEIWGERIIAIVIIAVVLPFVPLFYVSHLLYVFLTASIGMHELFALILAIVGFLAGLGLLAAFRTIRVAYFVSTTALLACVVYVSTLAESDAIWAGFLALLVLLVGGGLTVVAARFIPALSDLFLAGGDDGPWSQPALPAKVVDRQPELDGNDSRQPTVDSGREEVPAAGYSYPITDNEARSLLDRLDTTSIALLNALVETDEDHEDLGLLIWENVQAITGARDWRQFSRRVRAPIHRELRAVTGDSRAILLLRGLDDDQAAPSVVIEGPAVSALRRQFEQV